MYILAGIIIGVILLIWFWYLPWKKARGLTPKDAIWDPPVEIGPLLSPDECKSIIDFAEPRFERSTLVAKEKIDNTRTGETAWRPRDDPLAQKIIKKVIELTGKPFENCEDIQVVRYKPGQYYRPHHDACCEDNEHCIDFEREGGQRVGTLLVYLNDDFDEGWTHFPAYQNMKMRAKPGGAIFFRPLGRDDHRCHPFALHGGADVKNGTKYLCNVWVREEKFR